MAVVYNFNFIIQQLFVASVILLMNFTAKIKSARYKPNYILNVNIDIPLLPSQLLSDRPVSGEFTFSPSHLKKKLKLVMPTSKTSRNADSRKQSNLEDTQKTIAFQNFNNKKIAKSLVGSCSTSQAVSRKSKLKPKSEATSPSRKKMAGKSCKLLSSNKTIKNNKCLKYLPSESEDNLIGYTYQSNQMKKDQEKNLLPSQKLVFKQRLQSLQTPPFTSDHDFEEKTLITGIREFQKNAQLKKEHLNYLYLKEKILVLASVKKIQRAWRRYRTKKLLRSYSNDISLKFTSKMKVMSLEPKSILSVRSCGINGGENMFKKSLKNFDRNAENELQQMNYSEDLLPKQKSLTCREQKISARDKFQMQEFERWNELIMQIKSGKNIEDVLQKSFQRKQELEKEIKINKKKIFFQNKDLKEQQNDQVIDDGRNNEIKQLQQLQKTPQIDKFEKERIQSYFGTSTDKRRKKLQFFQDEIRKIDNEQSSSSQYSNTSHSDQAFDQSAKSSPHSKKATLDQEIEENLKLKKKLEILTKMSLLDSMREEEQNENTPMPVLKKQNKIKSLERITQKSKDESDCLNTFRKSSVDSDEDKQTAMQRLCKKLYREDDLVNLLLKIEDQIIYEVLLEFSEYDSIVLKVKELFEIKSKPIEDRPEGICTNLESIKDYLQNFVSFAFQQHGGLLLNGMKTPNGFSPQNYLKHIRSKRNPFYERNVIDVSIFNEHWNYASEQIYFDAKYPTDPEKELERTTHLKEITKIYFRAIFDGFNQCLDQFRYFGVTGRPFPWFPSLKAKSQTQIWELNDIKPFIKLAYRKLSQIAIVYCGLHFEDKKQSLPLEVMEEIKEERINTLLQIEIADNECKWVTTQEIRSELNLDICNQIGEAIIHEFCRELMGIL